KIVWAVHGIYALIGVSLNCLLLYCTYRYTPSSFRVFGLLVKLSLLYISYGPCGFINSEMCYVCYTITLFVYVITFYITLVSFLARLHIIKHGSITTKRTVVLLVGIATPAPLVFAGSFLTSKTDDETMMKIMKRNYSQYFQEDLIITGNKSLLTVQMFFVMLIVTILITPLYGCMLYTRSAILRRVNEANLKMSARTKYMHTQFVHMLTLQAALPLILIFAVLTFALGQFNIYHHPVIESVSIIFGETPSLISPVIVFFHIPSYRRAVQSMIQGRMFPPSELSNHNSSQERVQNHGTIVTIRSNT
ncbi:hypothetical protein PENTCL1PPCAC_19167, partial [Pristionchus entomophagus]